MTSTTRCWIVTDGAAGNLKQCLALAHYLDVAAERLDVRLRAPWGWLAPRLRFGAHRAIAGPLAARLDGPLPKLIISAGRRAALASIVLGQRARGVCFRVHLLDPRIDPRHFDVVVCPLHDPCRGPNVINTIGALNEVDDASLADWRSRWAERVGRLPGPRVAVLIGGSTRAVPVPEDALDRTLTAAEAIAGDAGTLLITTSRRTPSGVATRLRERFGSRAVFADALERESGENPYPGFLAWADHIFVTPDSVNMISEALGTGSPVHCVPPASGSARFRRFFDRLRAEGLLTSSDAPPEHRPPLRETAAVAAAVRRRWQEQLP